MLILAAFYLLFSAIIFGCMLYFTPKVKKDIYIIIELLGYIILNIISIYLLIYNIQYFVLYGFATSFLIGILSYGEISRKASIVLYVLDFLFWSQMLCIASFTVLHFEEFDFEN